MGQGRDVLIVYDDLTHHERAYRKLSLLLCWPSGGAKLTQRYVLHPFAIAGGGNLRGGLGGGSLTALPIVETEAQDISAYIPTNLISITDGRIYLKNLNDEDRESILRVAHAEIDGFGLAAPLEAGSLNQKRGVVGYFNTGPG
jgi:F0F1-type ATP synthase alpha subunit